MSKIRLVGGPFGGKVMESPDYGRNEIKLVGPKKMSRKQRYRWLQDNFVNEIFNMSQQVPRVEARYRIAKHPWSPSLSANFTPAMHPDGSIFYEFIEGSRRDY